VLTVIFGMSKCELKILVLIDQSVLYMPVYSDTVNCLLWYCKLGFTCEHFYFD